MLKKGSKWAFWDFKRLFEGLATLPLFHQMTLCLLHQIQSDIISSRRRENVTGSLLQNGFCANFPISRQKVGHPKTRRKAHQKMHRTKKKRNVFTEIFRPNFSTNFSGKKKARKHKSFWPVTRPVTGGSPDREARGLSFMCYPRNPRNINLFVRIPDREDRWPGRPVKVLYAKVLCAFSAP